MEKIKINWKVFTTEDKKLFLENIERFCDIESLENLTEIYFAKEHWDLDFWCGVELHYGWWSMEWYYNHNLDNLKKEKWIN